MNPGKNVKSPGILFSYFCMNPVILRIEHLLSYMEPVLPGLSPGTVPYLGPVVQN